MNNVLFNSDLLKLIINFVPIESKLILYKVCKFFNQEIPELLCSICDKSIYLPINIDNKLNCFLCESEYSNHETLENWDYYDNLREFKIINCKFCNIKCSSSSWLLYHIKWCCTKNITPIKYF